MLFLAGLVGIARGFYKAIQRGEGIRRKSDGKIMSGGSWALAGIGAVVLGISLVQLMK